MSETAAVEQEFVEDGPEIDALASQLGASVSSVIDASQLEDVPDRVDIIPKNTKLVFNLRDFKKGTSEPWKRTAYNPEGRPDVERFGVQPYYNCTFVAQQEPYTGRKVYAFLQGVSASLSAAKAAGDPVAIEFFNGRMRTVKEFLKGIGYQPTGKFDLETVLRTKPNVGIEVSEEKDQRGKPKNGVISFYYDQSATKR